MSDKTILVVDADQKIDQRITSTLEAEGFLVFSGASHVVSDEMAGKIKPSLIFIKPLSANAAGFQPCRMIHTIPELQHVPIVLLASLKGPIEPQHADYYGIVDALKLNFTAEELVNKTMSILATVDMPDEQEEETFLQIKEMPVPEEPLAAEGPGILTMPPAEQKELPNASSYAKGEDDALFEKPSEADTFITKVEPFTERQHESTDTRPADEDEFTAKDDFVDPSPSERPLPRRSYRHGRTQKSSLLPWLIGMLVLVVLGGGGFFAYQYFMSDQKPPLREPEKVAAPAPAPIPVPAPPVPVQEMVSSAQTPEPPPAASQPVPTAKEPSYSAQVGAFKTEDIAALLVNKLKSRGYEASAQKGVTKDNAPIVRVLVGKFSSRKDAMKLAAEIQEKEQIKTTVFVDR